MKYLLIGLLLFNSIGYSQIIIPLYEGEIPNERTNTMTEESINKNSGPCDGWRNVSKPSMQIYVPPKNKANGTGLLLFPGGGYSVECDKECLPFVEEFVKHGIAVFVIRYRLPSDSILVDKTIGPLQDAQQAMKLVRENASKYHVSINKIGVFGLSAGGHLAASVSTHFNTNYVQNIENTSVRPDFEILVCPVISMMDELAHQNSRKFLLGEHPTREQKIFFSNELQVTPETPITFLIHATDDQSVSVDHSLAFYQSLRKNKVSNELHLYPNGGHSFAFKIPVEIFLEPVFTWMQNNHLLENNN